MLQQLYIIIIIAALLAPSTGATPPPRQQQQQQQCGLSVPKCLPNKIIHQYKPTDPQSASASTCCAACKSEGAGCNAFQMVPGKNDNTGNSDNIGNIGNAGNTTSSSSCWLHSEYPSVDRLTPGDCETFRMVPAASPVRLARTSFSGVWVQHDPGHLADVVQQDFIVGADIDADWDELEIADGVWDWSSYDQQLDYAAAQGYFIETALQGGESTPHWLYNRSSGNKSVPLVEVVPLPGSTSKSHLRMFPYYLDPTYRGLFLRALQSLADHIASLPEKIRSRVIGVQVKFGDSGDDTPWHGTAQDSKWDISVDQWHNFTLPLTRPICDIYRNHSLHPLWNDNIEFLTYQTKNCPGSFIKTGMVTHGFQLTEEYDNYLGKGKVCHTAGMHCRGESWPFSVTGYFFYAPLKNTYAHLLWQLTFGVDMPQLSVPPLVNKSYYPIYRDVFNRYANSIPREPVTAEAAKMWAGAILNLRDGLDSADAARFPAAKYGVVQQGGKPGQTRMLAIANDPQFKSRGAVEMDVVHASKSPMGSRDRTAPNDVGWRIWPTNYGNGLMTQLNPNETSVGWWHVGPQDQYYGRYARGFDIASGRNKMGFTLDQRLWGGLPLSGIGGSSSSSSSNTPNLLKLLVVYFDGDGHEHLQFTNDAQQQQQQQRATTRGENTVSFEIAYDSHSGCRTAKTVTGSGSGRWVTVEVDVTDGRFGRGCARGNGQGRENAGDDDGADIVLKSTTDTIISTIEVYNPTSNADNGGGGHGGGNGGGAVSLGVIIAVVVIAALAVLGGIGVFARRRLMARQQSQGGLHGRPLLGSL